ncbi:YfcE family phosphodiesterase [Acidaminobacter sp. JC074]|uniref:YfcE family phosphodiesterase n=1 Tax=Acidaminobacter sp. JC074 TaxID=2530199 RepID=UPI001F0F5776|nr:YfcE family phosphodiesterase [Acidaminobacter sp. JC074]MCH4889874.1 YfcE family phosphodiesterase [Acidaminobacter sp. JC074]
MKILVFSDSHGKTNLMHQIIDKTKCDMIIHLGDCYDDFLELKDCYDIPMAGVVGNVDFISDGPAHEVISVGDYKIFITHGHRYRVKHHLLHLDEKTREVKADITLFGHTHIPMIEEGHHILMNPGSISRPRDARPSYGLIHINSKGIDTEIIYV